MIPELSSELHIGQILPPKNAPVSKLSDWEMGGIALGDSSGGLNVKPWKAVYTPGTQNVTVEAFDVLPLVIYSHPDIQWLSFCFDQNMRALVTFTDSTGAGYLYWYDPVAEDYALLPMGANVLTPHLFLDEKRVEASATSDVLLTYVRSGSLYLRVQRERYETEHELTDSILAGYSIKNFGMSSVNRLQWELQ